MTIIYTFTTSSRLVFEKRKSRNGQFTPTADTFLADKADVGLPGTVVAEGLIRV